MTDECRLMLLVQQGQLNKLAPLYEAYKVKLYNYFLHRGHSQSASEDLVQETFTKILAYRNSFTGEGTFKSWLYGIARNTAIDHYRKNRVSDQHVCLEDNDHQNPALLGQVLSEQHEQQRRDSIFSQSLQDIPAQDSEIILLSRVHQLKYEQIADLLGCNINTLKSKMQTAIRRLQVKFEELNGKQHGDEL